MLLCFFNLSCNIVVGGHGDLVQRNENPTFCLILFNPIFYSIDLKSLQAEHGSDVVPPSTRSLNYIALRYSEFPPEIMVSDFGVAPHILRAKNYIRV